MADEISRKDEVSSSNVSKRSISDVNVSEVHSTNSWEGADLGDDDRKKKFLRLMGAGKKSHHGRFLIGEETKTKHADASSSQGIADKIEKQFVESMEKKTTLGFKGRHQGIGFVEEEPKVDPLAPSSSSSSTLSSADSASAEKENPDVKSKSESSCEKEDVNVSTVHSANSWEAANLGDDDRKQKFLKLMGAGKMKHPGRFVIGDANAKHKSAEESQKDSEVIEKQFKESMEHKATVGFTGRHQGVGFHEEKSESDVTTSSADTTLKDVESPSSSDKASSSSNGHNDDKKLNEEALKTGHSKMIHFTKSCDP